jgi:hypothetical protein
LRYATDFRLARLVKWLLDMASSEQADDIVAALGDGDSLTRRFAAAAAARIADRTLGPLERAACSEDDDVRSFAKETLDGSL